MMDARAFYLLAYDIAADSRRAKIARLMESYGERVQFSLFEAYLTPAELEKVIKKARKILNDKEDSLRVYLLCQSCRGKVQMFGLGRITPEPGVRIV